MRDHAAEARHHQLEAVADAEHGNAGAEQVWWPGRDWRRARRVDRRWPAGQDDRRRALREDFRSGHGAGHDLRVHLALTNPARDQLRVLGPEVDHQDCVEVTVTMHGAALPHYVALAGLGSESLAGGPAAGPLGGPAAGPLGGPAAGPPGCAGAAGPPGCAAAARPPGCAAAGPPGCPAARPPGCAAAAGPPGCAAAAGPPDCGPGGLAGWRAGPTLTRAIRRPSISVTVRRRPATSTDSW